MQRQIQRFREYLSEYMYPSGWRGDSFKKLPHKAGNGHLAATRHHMYTLIEDPSNVLQQISSCNCGPQRLRRPLIAGFGNQALVHVTQSASYQLHHCYNEGNVHATSPPNTTRLPHNHKLQVPMHTRTLAASAPNTGPRGRSL